ncbi:MAG: hypothetical protein JEZ07_07480 [Phycisphaerae bacterium]|nr:hypothetical protein [Phycisphaerae bacterium]
MRLLTVKLLAAIVVFAFCALPVFAGSVDSQTFQPEKISAFDADIPANVKGYIMRGQYSQTQQPGNAKDKDVKAYPEIKSDKAIFGFVILNAKKCSYVIDDTQGKGYDKLIIDINADQDLTNDPVLKLDKKSPRAKDSAPGSIHFKPFKLKADGYEISFSASAVPVPGRDLGTIDTNAPKSYSLILVCQDAYKGNVLVNGKKIDVFYTQIGSMSDSFSGYSTALFMSPEYDFQRLSGRMILDGKFLDFKLSSAGDKLTVDTYNGPMGQLKFSFDDKTPKVNYMTINCQDGKSIRIKPEMFKNNFLELPVGQYLISSVGINLDHYQFGMTHIGQREPNSTIIADKPLIVDLKKTMTVAFALPKEDVINLKAKEFDVKVSAYFFSPELSMRLSGIRDLSKLEREIKMSNGQMYKVYNTLQPEVKITDTSGKVIAQGQMPFG